MSRYIDIDKFIEDNAEIIDCEIDHREYQDTIRELIEEAPLAEVKPIVYGEWIRGNKIHCLICNKSYADYVTNIEDEAELLLRSNYCPFCGAKMKKESEKEK